MSDDHNPYDAPQSCPITRQAAPLSVFEYATAIVAAVSVAILSFFLTCTGIVVVGVSTDSVGFHNARNTTTEAVFVALVKFLPGVFAVIGGVWTFKAFLKTRRTNSVALTLNLEPDDSDRARQVLE